MPLDRLMLATYALLLGVTVSGIAVFAWGVGAPGYFGLIGLHQWIALALLPLAPLALGRHLVNTSSRAWATGACIAAGGFLAIPIPFLLVLPEEEHDDGPFSFLLSSLGALLEGDMGAAYPAIAGLSLLGLVGLATVLTLVGLTSRVRERDASRRTGLALTLLVAWAWFSGLLLFFEGVRTLRSAQMFHSFCGCWTAGVLLLHLAAKRAAAARIPRVAVAAFGLLWLVAFGVIWGAWTRAQGSRYTLEHHGFADGLTEEELGASRTCGTAGCHEVVLDQWRGSPHRFAGSNAFYRAAVDELVGTRGIDAATTCAACHDPVRALAGTVQAAYADGVPHDSEGVSCVACHIIEAATTSPPGNGQYTVAIETSYPTDPQARVSAIRRDARRHQTAFASADAIYSNTPCRVCHRVEHHGQVLQEADMPGADLPDPPMKCRICHLTPDGPITYGHTMAGVNTDLAHYTDGDAEAVAVQVALAEQALTRSVGRLDVDGAIVDGALRIDLTTVRGQQAAGGHSFPSGPVDLQQVWAEITVTDAAGSVVATVGALDDDQRITGDPPRLGARALDGAGQPIARHQVLDVVEVVDRQQLAGQGIDSRQRHRVTLELADEPAFPLAIAVRWMHRRTNPDFARWALGVDRSPIEARELIAASATVPAP